ncbi:MAG: acyl-CoA dehydrogenase family protein [Chloroflexi bacterium]|nr:acyl-CoA dehydrogenase family protein [Chloroflexota bacterium]
MDFSLTDAQKEIQARAREFAQTRVAPLSREMDERGEMPRALIDDLARTGLLGGPLPKEFFGGAWDSISLALCYEELGRVDSSVRGFMTVHTSLVAQCILKWGNAAQKKNYLPKLAHGEMIGCYALTEPNAGSDAASIETTAARDGDAYLINGEKIWITNGVVAKKCAAKSWDTARRITRVSFLKICACPRRRVWARKAKGSKSR